MNYVAAKKLAEKYAALIQPGCTRLEIVGSVKRGDKAEVHDIEYLVIADERPPRLEFGMKNPPKNRLLKVLQDLCDEGLLRFIKGADRLRQYAILGAGEVNPFCMEVYIVSAETWGIQNVIRTGPAEFSHRYVTPRQYGGLLPDDLEYVRGETKICRGGAALALPEERDALALLGLGWIEPKERRRYVK